MLMGSSLGGSSLTGFFGAKALDSEDAIMGWNNGNWDFGWVRQEGVMVAGWTWPDR